MKHAALLAVGTIWIISHAAASDPLTLTDGAQVGMSSERLERIDRYFKQMVDAGELPGAINLVARNGKIVHLRSQGSLSGGEPIRPDTIVRIASMTKPITSVAMMMLYEEGRFQLNDAVSRYIPSFKNQRVLKDVAGPITDANLVPVSRPMSIRDVFTHTAGLPFGGGKAPVNAHYREKVFNPENDLMAMADAMGEAPLFYQPGTWWAYSSATTLLGALVEKISGIPFEEFLERRIFDVLGMEDTAFYVAEAKLGRLALLYRVGAEGGYTEVDGVFLSRDSKPPTRPNGSGGLFSTMQDYYAFAQMLAGGGAYRGERLLSPKSIELMTMNHLQPGVELPDVFARTYLLKGYGFGLGFRVRQDVAASQLQGNAGEYGWGGAFETYFLVDPAEELVAINLTQLAPTGQYPIRRQFNNLVYQAIIGPAH